jgi:predicted aspartyl protease
MAAVLLEDNADKNVKDGLLGMSFLNRFNVKIDLKEKKMTLLKMDDYK